MKNKLVISAAVICLSLILNVVSLPQTKNLKDETKQSEKAARVFSEIVGTPDKSIPKELLESAEWVAVFPSILKAGFVVGGRGGRGVASCRTARGWSAP